MNSELITVLKELQKSGMNLEDTIKVLEAIPVNNLYLVEGRCTVYHYMDDNEEFNEIRLVGAPSENIAV